MRWLAWLGRERRLHELRLLRWFRARGNVAGSTGACERSGHLLPCDAKHMRRCGWDCRSHRHVTGQRSCSRVADGWWACAGDRAALVRSGREDNRAVRAVAG